MSPRRDRPLDLSPIATEQLPATPPVDRNIPAEAWVDAPDELLRLGDDIGQPTVLYLRRLGPWFVWRAGPGTTSGGPTRWMALHWDDLERRLTFELRADGTGHGIGPEGVTHERFRTWKESLHQDRS
ncbi:MAG: hypothetical protein IT196_17400 [Acidimicrobiales bacterium]|nr:hypothetical protein [Acidimicrobiales bacterium]